MSCSQTSTGVPLLGCCHLGPCTIQAGADTDEVPLAGLEALVNSRLDICSAFANPRCTGFNPATLGNICYGFSLIGGITQPDLWLGGSIPFAKLLTCFDDVFNVGYLRGPGGSFLPLPGRQYPFQSIDIFDDALVNHTELTGAFSYYAIRSDGHALLIKQQWQICSSGFDMYFYGGDPFCLHTVNIVAPPPAIRPTKSVVMWPGQSDEVTARNAIWSVGAAVPIRCTSNSVCTIPAPPIAQGPFLPSDSFDPAGGNKAYTIYATFVAVAQPPC